MASKIHRYTDRESLIRLQTRKLCIRSEGFPKPENPK